MRNIRLAVVLLVMAVAILPKPTLASETSIADIKTKIDLKMISNFFFPEPVLADESAETAIQPIEAAQQPVKTEEEIKNEAILAKWKEKQAAKWAGLSKEPFVINASAYTASADECGNNKGVTASGIKVKENRTIACPPAFPFGAKIEIEGMGTYVCEDRGGAIKGNKIDIYMQTKAEAFQFGRRNLMARVVE